MTDGHDTRPVARRQFVRATADADATVLPIRRQTLAEMTLDAVRDGILRGRYPVGEALRQRTIADELGVSRIPVREALRQLQAEGLVTFSAHRGAVVSALSVAEIMELFELRAEIEGDLICRAIPLMSAEDLARARDLLDAYDRALRAGTVSEWGELNWRFHSALYAPSRRDFTLTVVDKLHKHSERYLRMQLALTHGERRASEEHRAILSAAERGAAEMGMRLMREHILGAGRSLVSFLEERRHERTALKRQASS